MAKSLHGTLEAGLDPASTHYRVAMEYLRAEEVLEEAEESRGLGGGSPLYTITLRGMEMHGDAARSVTSAARTRPDGPGPALSALEAVGII